jgi:hypothetical protein
MKTDSAFAIAAIIGTVHSFTSIYNARIGAPSGTTYEFVPDRDSQCHRRYILDRNDPEKGIHPLAKAREEIADISLACAQNRNNFQVTWRFVTVAELEAEEAVAAKAREAKLAEDEAQRSQLAAARKASEAAKQTLEDVSRGNLAPTPAPTPAPPTAPVPPPPAVKTGAGSKALASIASKAKK